MDQNTTQSQANQGAAVLVGSGTLLGASELTKIKTVTRWVTSDGKDHCSLSAAEYHAGQMDKAAKANAVLESGGSVADALRAAEWTYASAVPEVLERVTKESKLVIEHWQCRDTPGYQVRYFTSARDLYVNGNAGCWSGSYGSRVSLDDLARYATHMSTDFSPNHRASNGRCSLASWFSFF